MIYEEAENKKEKVNISFEDFIKASEGLNLGNGAEEVEQAALETITKRLSEYGCLPLITDYFDVIPNINGYLVLESTTELYNIM